MQPENNWQEAVYTVYIIYLIYINMNRYVYIYIQYIYIHMYMYTYVCISLYIYIQMGVYIYTWYTYSIHMCIYTYTIYIYNHTYIYRRPISRTQKPYIRIYAILDFIETLKHCFFCSVADVIPLKQEPGQWLAPQAVTKTPDWWAIK